MGIEQYVSSIISCSVGVLFGLVFILDGGYYLVVLFDKNVTLISCFVIILMQCYIAAYYLKEEKLNELSLKKTGLIVPKYIFYVIKYVCPIMFIIFVIKELYNSIFKRSINYYPVFWPWLIEVILIALPLYVIFYFYFKYKDDFKKEEIITELGEISSKEYEKKLTCI